MEKHGLVVTASGGNSSQIPAMFIVHIDATAIRRASKINLAWRKMVLKCLQKAEEMKLTSLAFPALGTGEWTRIDKFSRNS
jgi:O-acetyl-ADP-ribose deacetylase (regulator of RNase III)